MSYKEYRDAVKEQFLKLYGDSVKESDADKFISEKDIDSLVRSEYETYQGKNEGNISPKSTASTLYMLY